MHVLLISTLIVCAVAAYSGEPQLFSRVYKIIETKSSELLMIEKTLAYVEAEEARIAEIRRRLEVIRKENEGTEPLHPISATAMIRRYVGLWKELFRRMSDFRLYDMYSEYIDSVASQFPTANDLNGAYVALSRLQEVYRLRTSDLAAGEIGAFVSESGLLPDDMDEMSRLRGSRECPQQQIEWLQQKFDHINDTDIRLSVTLRLLQLANDYGMADSYSIFQEQLRREHPEHSLGYENSKFSNSQETRQEHPYTRNFNYNKYAAACRKAINETTNRRVDIIRSDDSNLFCYKQRLRLEYGYIDVEVLSLSPRVLRFYEVLRGNDGRNLVELGLPKMMRAQVGATEELSEVSDVRIGHIGWLYDWEDPTARAVSRRVYDVTGLNLEYATAHQVSTYGIGGHYEPHYDAFNMSAGILVDGREAGDRVATVMFYVNNVTLGGATVFNELGLAVLPVANSAVFWHNLFPNGSVDPRTLHAACPVIYGEKWVINKWIHSFGQEHCSPCQVDQFAEW